MQKNLNSFVRYDEDDNVVPMSLVKMNGYPQMPGKWKQVRSVCCDPNSEKFLNNSTPMKAWLIIDHKGEPRSGPVLRKLRPTGVFSMQIQYNACCDSNALAPVITLQPVGIDLATENLLTVSATGTGLTYQWYKVGAPDPDTALVNGADFSQVSGPQLEILNDEVEGLFYVIVTNQYGQVKSDIVTVISASTQ